MQSDEINARPDDRLTVLYVTLLVPLSMLFAEVVAIYFSSAVGLVSYSLLMQVLFVHTAINWRGLQRYLLVLSLIPVFRILGYSLPLAGLSVIYWYVVMSVPLLLTCLYVMRTLKLTWGQMGFRIAPRRLPLHLLLALSGAGVGFVLYQIAPPQSHPPPTNIGMLIFHAVVWFVCVAAIEEFIFRGIILHGMLQLGRGVLLNSIYIALLYTILHINHETGPFLAVIFGYNFILNLAASAQPRSILGTTLGHGLLNIVYFAVLPFASLP